MAIFFLIVGIVAALSTITCADKAEELKADVEKFENLINEEQEKNKEISEILTQLNEQMELDLASLQIHGDAIAKGIDREVEVLLQHRDELTKKYKEEADLLKEIEELEIWINLHDKKLNIFKKDLDMFATRRSQGADLECQTLLNNSSISTRSLGQRQSRDDELVYSTLLNRLETVLTYTKKLHAQLLKELEHKLQLKADIKINLEEKVALSANDLVIVGNAVVKLKKNIDQAQATIDKLLSKIYGLEKRKKSVEAELRQVIADLEDYEQDSVCFKTLERSVQARR